MMQSRGVLPEDAPDPSLQLIDQLRTMPVPILGLVPQPHIEDWGSFALTSGTSNGVTYHMAAGITYTFWRNPDDHDDPVNLAELDEMTRRAVDMQTAWPRPKWLLDRVARMRYPLLHEAVRTTWRGHDTDRPSAAVELVVHVNHILMNHYRARMGDGSATRRHLEPTVNERHVQHDVPVLVNGDTVDGIRIDTDPFVFGIGADLDASGVLTAVVDREALPFLSLKFATRTLDR